MNLWSNPPDERRIKRTAGLSQPDGRQASPILLQIGIANFAMNQGKKETASSEIGLFLQGLILTIVESR